MKTKTSLQVFSFFFILLVVIDVALYLNFKNKENNISLVLAKTDFENRRQSHMSQIKLIVDETKTDREKIDNYIVPADGAVSYVEMIERKSLENDVKIDIGSAEISPIKASRIYASTTAEIASSTRLIKTKINITGTWSKVLNFLVVLENLPYRLVIEKIDLIKGTMTSGDKKVLKGDWTAVVDVVAVIKK